MTIKTVVMALSIMVLIFNSYVLAEDTVPEGLLADGDVSIQGHTEKERYQVGSLLNYDSTASERFALFRGTRERRPTAWVEGQGGSHVANMDIYNIPQSLVNNISYDFSKSGMSRSSNSSILELPSSMNDIFQIGAAFLTNLVVHEFGHEVVAQHVGAEGSRLNFFSNMDGQFFLGTSSVEKIDRNSKLPYTMGGEFFADLTFEHALQDYRKKPNMYNKSLLLYSGTDFLLYCFYAFYLSSDNPSYDPITISKETGISREALLSVALAKTLLNAYRVYSGQDKVVPYFTVDRYSASLNIMIPFDIGS